MKNIASTTAERIAAFDFFRGYALVAIFINHMPANPLFYYTPSRFGLSDAAEIFVFISGYMAALAFGRNFESCGLGLGSVRVLLRCGQIYMAHLSIFFAMAAICVFGNALPGGHDYISGLSLQGFFDYTADVLPALFTLRYVPNYFDILPLYCVMMLWVPVVWALSRIHVRVALAFPLALYLATWHFHLELPADPLTDRPWFFNPFGWQLMFYTGYALGAGWIKPPPGRRWLLALCALFVLLSVPLGHEATYQQHSLWGGLRASLEPLLDKSHLGPLRWLHFLALAYLASHLLRPRRHWLEIPMARRLAQIGQHALPMFLFGMPLSFLAGMALDQTGRSPLAVALVNLGGILLMVQAAGLVAWLRSKPWKILAVNGAGARQNTGESMIWQQGKQACVLASLALLALAPLLMSQHRPAVEEPEPILSANHVETEPSAGDDDEDDFATRLELGDRI